mgnify:CR=1 FL=1
MIEILRSAEIKEISEFDFVHIGNHSHSHDYLVDKTDEQIKKDLKTDIKINTAP